MPRHHSIYARVVHIKPLCRYAITLSALIAVGAVWFFVKYEVIDTSIFQSMAEIKTLREQVSLMQQTTKNIVQLEASTAQLQSQFKLLASKYQSPDYMQGALMNLINQAGACKLAMQQCTIDDQKDEGWYTKNTVSIDVSGTFDQLLKFTQSLATCSYLMAMHNATIAHTNNGIFNLKCGLDIVAVK